MILYFSLIVVLVAMSFECSGRNDRAYGGTYFLHPQGGGITRMGVGMHLGDFFKVGKY